MLPRLSKSRQVFIDLIQELLPLILWIGPKYKKCVLSGLKIKLYSTLYCNCICKVLFSLCLTC